MMTRRRMFASTRTVALLPFLVQFKVLCGKSLLEEGAYTIVNKASGRRIFASTHDGLFNTVDDAGPIYRDQMWLFAPQTDQSYAIINAANGLRIFAQSGMGGEHGFFATGNGPLYQDQKWRLLLQADGSYVIANAKSSRRILARANDNGGSQFTAVAHDGPAHGDETWWLINQNKDSTAQIMIELQLQKNITSRLTEGYLAAKNETSRLVLQLQGERVANAELLEKVESQKVLAGRAIRQAKIEMETAWKSRHAEQAQIAQDTIERMRSQLQAALASNKELGAAIENYTLERTDLQRKLRDQKDTVATLIKEMDMKSEQVNRLTLEIQTEKSGRAKLAEEWALPISFPFASLLNHIASCSRQTIGIAVLTTLIMLIMCCDHYKRTVRELKERRLTMKQLEAELATEISGMLKVGESGDGLGVDYGFQIHDTDLHGEMVRSIKIQCPGVDHADVEVELISNGCIVTIRRCPQGGDATTWTKRFQFRPSEGPFEFKEDQMQLEKGFLYLVFRRYSHQSRVIRFPHHFSLAATDTDKCWEYAIDEAADDVNEADAWWYETKTSADAHKHPQCFQTESAHRLEMDTMSTASTARASA